MTAYQDINNLVGQTLPSGRVIVMERDGVRRLSQIRAEVDGVEQALISSMTYRGDNQMLSSTFGNGVQDIRQYDLQGRLTNQMLQGTVTLDQRSYTYDKNSNITNINATDQTSAYGYDPLDRVTSDQIDVDPAIDFTYDQNDNRLTRDQDQYDLDNGGNQLLQRESLVESGTLPAFASRELVYNDAGRLFQLVEDGSLKAEYRYNDNGLRTRKTVHDGLGGSTTIVYLYDQFGQLVSETSDTGAPLRDYLWHDGGEAKVQIDSIGSDVVRYLHSDHLLTTRLASDTGQQIVWRWQGEAFGNTQAEELAGAGVEVNLRFPGQYFDGETNLHYNHFRYYDPQIGRYITSDPVGLVAGFGTYGYSAGNPILYFDPTGESFCTIAAGAVGGALGGALSGAIQGALTGGLPGLVGGLYVGGIGGAIGGAVGGALGGSLEGGLQGGGTGGILGSAFGGGVGDGMSDSVGGGEVGGVVGGFSGGLSGLVAGALLSGGGQKAILAGLPGVALGTAAGGIAASKFCEDECEASK
jgi:RHS repeat-associated protein